MQAKMDEKKAMLQMALKGSFGDLEKATALSNDAFLTEARQLKMIISKQQVWENARDRNQFQHYVLFCDLNAANVLTSDYV